MSMCEIQLKKVSHISQTSRKLGPLFADIESILNSGYQSPES